MQYINLISDTITKPTKEMLDYMYSAEVGDDVFSEESHSRSSQSCHKACL